MSYNYFIVEVSKYDTYCYCYALKGGNMRKKKTFIGMVILIAILVLGVGYAAVSNITLNLTGSANIKANADFSVVYDTTHTVVTSTNDTVEWATSDNRAVVAGSYTDTTNATMTVYLDSTHKTAYAIYKVDNNSTELAATLAANVTQIGSPNNAYFDTITAVYYTDANCTQALGNNALAHGQSAYLKVTVGYSHSPITDVTSASFSVTTTATPQEAS